MKGLGTAVLCGMLVSPLPAQECDPCSLPAALYCISERKEGPKRSTWDKENGIHFYYLVLNDLPSNASLMLSTHVRVEAVGHLPEMFSVYADVRKSGTLLWSRVEAHLYFDLDLDGTVDEHYVLRARWNEARDFYKGTLRTMVKEAKGQERPLEYLVSRLEEVSAQQRAPGKPLLFEHVPLTAEDLDRYAKGSKTALDRLCLSASNL